MSSSSAQSLIHFGLGARSIDGVMYDPRGALKAQLAGPDPALASPGFAGLPSGLDGVEALQDDMRTRLAILRAGEPLQGNYKPRTHEMYVADGKAQLDWAANTHAGFRERLVWFWTNHFTVSILQGETAALVGPMVREAIRPHVNGNFTDMVLAVERHPAMLRYLANDQSIGPDSVIGQRTGRGLNENLGRECMELHTVGLAAGYTQTDVTNMAKLLTGWSIAGSAQHPGGGPAQNTPGGGPAQLNPGGGPAQLTPGGGPAQYTGGGYAQNTPGGGPAQYTFGGPAQPPDTTGFKYHPNAHEPGMQVVLGESFGGGEQGGIDALTYLSQHATTYQLLARKLVTHFVADQPPPDAVALIAGVLLETGGDLAAAAAALVDLPAAWLPGQKLKTPMEYMVSVLRAAPPPPGQSPVDYPGVLNGLGQPLWAAPMPNGWPDQAADWDGSGAVMSRIDWAYTYSGRFDNGDMGLQPADTANAALGPLLRPATADAIAHAGSRREALTLLFASPEFQRR